MQVHLANRGLGCVLQLMYHCQGQQMFPYHTYTTVLMIDSIPNGPCLAESGLRMMNVLFWDYSSRLMAVKGVHLPPEFCGLSVQSYQCQVVNK